MTVGDKIYELRTSRNMSLREFANLVGVTHTTIARLESTSFIHQKVYLDTVYQICKKLNYDFAEFLTETGYIRKSNEEINSTVGTVHDTATYSTEERELVKKYRELNAPGKNLVKTVIDAQLATMAESKKNKIS